MNQEPNDGITGTGQLHPGVAELMVRARSCSKSDLLGVIAACDAVLALAPEHSEARHLKTESELRLNEGRHDPVPAGRLAEMAFPVSNGTQTAAGTEKNAVPLTPQEKVLRMALFTGVVLVALLGLFRVMLPSAQYWRLLRQTTLALNASDWRSAGALIDKAATFRPGAPRLDELRSQVPGAHARSAAALADQALEAGNLATSLKYICEGRRQDANCPTVQEADRRLLTRLEETLDAGDWSTTKAVIDAADDFRVLGSGWKDLRARIPVVHARALMKKAEEALALGDADAALRQIREALLLEPGSQAAQELKRKPFAPTSPAWEKARREMDTRRQEAADAEAGTYAQDEYASACESEKAAQELGNTLDGYAAMEDASRRYAMAASTARAGKKSAAEKLRREAEAQAATATPPVSSQKLEPVAVDELRRKAQSDARDAIDAAMRTGSTRDYLAGVAPNRIRMWEDASRNGIPEASWLLGCCHENGVGVQSSDLARAFEYYLRAAEKDYGPALNDAGLCYSKGKGTAKDAARAVAYYRRAAELGRPGAWFNLGSCYEQGIGGLSKDIDKAVECYKKAQSLGYRPAERVLAAIGR